MAELVGGALLGKAVDVLYESLEKLIGQNLNFGSNLQQIRSSLDSFKPYIQKMTDVFSEAELQGLLTVIKNGEILAGKCLVKGSKWNPIKTSKYADQLLEWDKSLKRQLEILNFSGVIDVRKTAVSVQNVEVDVRDIKTVVEISGADTQEIKTIVQDIVVDLQDIKTATENAVAMTQETETTYNEDFCALPELPTHTVGLEVPIQELKRMMLEHGKSMIVVNAMGGSGKTTLAISFCRDPKVKERFGNNIFFVTVSENFNLERIVQQLYQRKGLHKPDISSKENAVTWLQTFLKKDDKPLLLVLDDVWSESFLRKFQLEKRKDYKILVTSRSQLLSVCFQDCHYKLESLNPQDAMQLFSYSAKCSDPELTKVIVESCKGLPLGLKVVGGSLSGKSRDIWLQKKNELSKGRPPSKPEDELYDCLQRSLDDLDKKNKEYFLDLGAFPDHKRISVGALIDMWAEIYDDFDLSPGRDELIYEEEDTLCNAELMKFNSCDLANLVDTRKDKKEWDRYRKGNYVILHDLLKNLAIRQSLEPEEQRKRLIIDIRGNNVPKWWGKQKYQPEAQARLLSVSTDSGFTMKLPNMTLTEAEVLILNFRTRKYILPEFVENMPELKVLLVKYDGFSCAELDNFQQLCSLPSLKRITLESLSIRSITESHFILKSLVKLSLILCDLSLAISNDHVRISDALPKLEEMIIDRCYNCDEFLTQCCDLVHLTKLSIINCRDLVFLTERIGSLVNLELLRLRSCSGLKILPDSVANLKNLMFLDISECSSIGTLPVNIGEMSSLTKLDLRHCRDTDELRQSVLRLQQLKEVICTCYPGEEHLWEAVKPRFGRIHILEIPKRFIIGENKFSSGLESANFMLNSDPVHLAWNAIEKQKQINPTADSSLFNEIQPENPTIIVFGTPPSSLQGQEALVSSSNLKEDNFDHFEFLCNKSNTNFSLNQAVVKLFQSKYEELLQLKKKLLENCKSKTPSLVIITGQSVGGTVATLFILWLLQGYDLSTTKRPLCVTFGSPLVGDEQLRRRVLNFTTWKSCFLHIVSDQDPTPQLFSSRKPGVYKPFGTFLLCSASGCACFEDPDIILEQLVKANSQNQECHYGQILGDLKGKALCNVSNSIQFDDKILEASLLTQLQAIGILSQPTENTSLFQRMKKHEVKLIIQKKKISDSDKKLNDMKVYMVFLEWYKKDSRLPKIGGYYDRYRNTGYVNVKEYKKKLMQYWEDSVIEVEHNPQKEGAHFRFRWIWAGTYYRRMVEPLHIADYYNDGKKNYKTDGKRPRHFILLEEWLIKIDKPQEVLELQTKKKKEVLEQSKRQNVGARLNEDSCFWAHVEDACILCNLVKDGSSVEKERALQELKSFEADVYASLKNYALSPEIFLKKSSFMRWWMEYKEVVEQPYSSLLLDFMKNRHYEEYKEGKFI